MHEISHILPTVRTLFLLVDYNMIYFKSDEFAKDIEEDEEDEINQTPSDENEGGNNE